MIKPFRSASVLSAIAALFLLAAPSAHAGSVIRGQATDSVYYVSGNSRYVFPNQSTFLSWYPDFSGVVTVSDAELSSVPLAGNVTYRPGVRLVKVQTDPKTYAVDKGGVLRWVTSEAAARDLYGDDWNRQIDDVPDIFFTNYRVGEPISSRADFVPAEVIALAMSISDDKRFDAPLAVISSVTVGQSQQPTQPIQQTNIQTNDSYTAATQPAKPDITFTRDPVVVPYVGDDGLWRVRPDFESSVPVKVTGNLGPFPPKSGLTTILTFSADNHVDAKRVLSFETGKGVMSLGFSNPVSPTSLIRPYSHCIAVGPIKSYPRVGAALLASNTDSSIADLNSLTFRVSVDECSVLAPDSRLIVKDLFGFTLMDSPVMGGLAQSNRPLITIPANAINSRLLVTLTGVSFPTTGGLATLTIVSAEGDITVKISGASAYANEQYW
ncbi:MAG: hypothetical protein PHT59_04090 [Candidatus Omnitrophica bacterium]|nr:hypothetical protein [Candidatus Omnitrophota bacterium]